MRALEYLNVLNFSLGVYAADMASDARVIQGLWNLQRDFHIPNFYNIPNSLDDISNYIFDGLKNTGEKMLSEPCQVLDAIEDVAVQTIPGRYLRGLQTYALCKL